MANKPEEFKELYVRGVGGWSWGGRAWPLLTGRLGRQKTEPGAGKRPVAPSESISP
jgi:hypothetical protein